MHLHFELISGIAGDMTVAALLDLGVPLAVVEAALSALPLEGYTIATRRVDCGMAVTGLKFDVRLDDGAEAHSHGHSHGHGGGQDHEQGRGHSHDHVHSHAHEHSRAHEHKHEHDHSHEHSHDSGHGHDHTHGHDHSHGHSHEEGSWGNIKAMLNEAPLAPEVRRIALAIFERIAEAEARVHGMTIDEVGFHEVGAVDSIVDIVGVAACIAHLSPTRVTFSPVPLGRGFTMSQHGRIPVPAPATLLILQGATIEGTSLSYELVTPTGAGVIAALGSGFGPVPRGTLVHVGHGAGTRKLPDRPNLVRAMLLAPEEVSRGAASHESSEDLVMEANIDDATGELCGYLSERLFEAGALDVWWTSIMMKKGRPAQKLSVLCQPAHYATLLKVIMRESTSIGVRLVKVNRDKSHRRCVDVSTPYGDVAIKVAAFGGVVTNIAPEYESARQVARATDTPLKLVLQAAMAAGWSSFPEGSPLGEPTL